MIQQEAADGNIPLTYRPMIFLDANLGTDSSERAADACGCVDTDGAEDVPQHRLRQPARDRG